MIQSRSANSLTHLLLFGSVAFSVMFAIKVIWTTSKPIVAGTFDFSHFYASARLVRDGKGDKLYDYQTQYEVQQQLFEYKGENKGPLTFFTLSYTTLFWLPLTFFPYLIAYIVWAGINISILFFLSNYLTRHLPFAKSAFNAPLILVLLGFFPVAVALIQGQSSILLLLIFSLTFVLLKRNQPFIAGSVLAIGLFKFQLVLPFVAIYFLLRHWKFVSGFLTGSLIPIGTSIYISGWRGSLEHIQFLIQANKNLDDLNNVYKYSLTPIAMSNLRGFIYRIFSGVLSERVIIYLVILFSIFILVWTVRKLSQQHKNNFEITFASALLGTLLVSYHLLLHDLILLLLPILIIINSKMSKDYQRKEYASAMLPLLLSPISLILLNVHFLSFVSLLILWLLLSISYDFRFRSNSSLMIEAPEEN